MQTLLKRAYRLIRYPNRRARLWRLVNRLEIRLQRQALATYPPFLTLDPISACNLRCVCCPTGEGISKLSKEPLTPDNFRRIAGNLRMDRLAHAGLYYLGEPLLNPHLAEYIRFFAERGITTVISANFSAKDYDREFLERLIRSGLDTITVSVDGTTQETYEKYRQGGSLERVLGNMRRLNEVKRSLGADRPRLVFKMLLNKVNEHQVTDAKQLAADIGAEFYQPHFFHIQDALRDDWTAEALQREFGTRPQTCVEDEDGSHTYVDTECRQLWDTLTVTSNGDVLPCCFAWNPAFAVGNLVREPVSAIWNNDKMRTLRRYVTVRDAPPPSFPNPCTTCTHRFCTFWQRPA